MCVIIPVQNTEAMSPIIEKVGESFYLGEGPHWDVQSQTLYLIDAFPKLIARYDPKTNTVVKAILGKQ